MAAAAGGLRLLEVANGVRGRPLLSGRNLDGALKGIHCKMAPGF